MMKKAMIYLLLVTILANCTISNGPTALMPTNMSPTAVSTDIPVPIATPASTTTPEVAALPTPTLLSPTLTSPPPISAGLDTATTRLTDAGLFHVSFSSALDPIAINRIHSWVLHVETAGGQPVANAVIGVNGGMPEHGHGLPTQPQVTQNLGNGDYLVEGLKFQMPGWWEVQFDISAGDQSDTVTFNLVL
jgi:hypothetical protein